MSTIVCVERRGQKICARGGTKESARRTLRSGEETFRLRAKPSASTKAKRRAAGRRLQRDYKCKRSARTGRIVSCNER